MTGRRAGGAAGSQRGLARRARRHGAGSHANQQPFGGRPGALDGVLAPVIGHLRVDPVSLSWRFSRSSGPGGQHVNTTESQVELRCDLTAAGLPPAVAERVVARLGPEVRVVASTERSQLRNRAEAWRRLAEQLDRSLAA